MKEKINYDELKIAAISDFQSKSQEENVDFADKANKELQGDDFDKIVQLGDLAFSDVQLELIDQAKKLSKAEIEDLKKDSKFSEMLNKYKRIDKTYDIYTRETNPDIQRRHQESIEKNHKDILDKLKNVDNRLSLIRGNFDQDSPEQAELVGKIIKDYGLTRHDEPHLEEIGESSAILYWPYQNVKNEGDEARLEEWARKFRDEIGKYNQVIIAGHEHIFKGPSEEIYQKNIKESGIKGGLRTPRNQPNPSYKYIWQVIQGLKPEAKALYVFGHLHVTEEEIKAGYGNLLKDKTPGKFRVAVNGDIGNTREVKLVYFPQQTSGKIHLKDGKAEIEKKLI